METHVRLSETDNPDPLGRWFASRLEPIQKAVSSFYEAYWPSEVNKPEELELSVTFLTPDEIAQINEQYRNEPHSTDVLSFPLWEESEGVINLPEEIDGPLPLGDLFFCGDKCRENAALHGVSEHSELALLLFHGCLHLLAWDHATEESEQAMWKVQEAARDQLLAQLGEEA